MNTEAMETAQKPDKSESGSRTTWSRFMTEEHGGIVCGLSTTFWGEVNKLSCIAMPMIVVSLSHFLLRAVPIMMLGHLSELALASASVANSFSNVTGFSIILGMACALETLCGQAYGAKHYKKLGTFTCGAIVWLCLACLPVSLLWIYTDRLLILIGQDPEISVEARKFSVWLIPSLFPYAILQALVRFLQTQSIILPMLVTSFCSLCLHFPISWALIFKLNLGNAGAAIAVCFSYWLNVIALVLYVKYSPACSKTRPSFSKDIFRTFREFFRLAIPSAAMICLEWWTFEIIILLSGLLPNPQLQTSVLSICFLISSTHFFIQHSFGTAASTRVSNELGAGKPQAAQSAVSTVMVLSTVESIIASIVIFLSRYQLGHLFSNEESVIDYVKELTPFICFSIIMESIQTVLSGVARGSGWQHIGAYVNLGSYYLVAIPVSLLLGFFLHLKGKGLWSGLLVGTTVQSVLLVIIAYRTNWEKQTEEARRRISGKAIQAADELI